MAQMTRGPEHIAPCYENDWPLDATWKIDDPRVGLREGFRRWRGPTTSLLVLVFSLVLVLLAFLVALVRSRPAADAAPAGNKPRPVLDIQAK